MYHVSIVLSTLFATFLLVVGNCMELCGFLAKSWNAMDFYIVCSAFVSALDGRYGALVVL